MSKHIIQLESRTAHDCFKIATRSLELANRSSEEWEKDHHAVTGITFSAFAIEAMLNHYGKIYYPDWNNMKDARKEIHKKLFIAVNLPDYLGSKTYQIAKTCFTLRDNLAHGKTTHETVHLELPDGINDDEAAIEVISLKSISFQKLSVNALKTFIETAKIIEKDIEGHGFYPENMNNVERQNKKLSESPLGTSGTRLW